MNDLEREFEEMVRAKHLKGEAMCTLGSIASV